jgi:hypothetical protein
VKNCLFCKKFFYFSGTPDYGEMTPGSNVEIGCSVLVKRDFIWQFNYLDSEDEFRAKMSTAETCKHYVQREDDSDG